MQGFLSMGTVSEKIHQTQKMAQCVKCGLRKGCLNPNMPPVGENRKGVLFITDGLSPSDDRLNRPLTGKGERLVRTVLENMGIDLWKDCSVVSCCTCASSGELAPRQVESCRPNVWKSIKKTNPKVIIPMGNNAARSLFSHRTNQDANVALWRGYQIPDVHGTGAWVCPTSDPAFILDSSKYGEVALELFRQDLHEAIGCLRKELPKGEDLEEKTITEPETAMKLLERTFNILNKKPCFLAVDYETNMLKPHSKRSRLVSIGLASDFTEPFAVMVHNDDSTKRAASEVIGHPNARLIAANMLMEIGWTEEQLGLAGCNWVWDTVLAAHILDNRRKVANVKFQGFVNFGIEEYDQKVHSLIRSEEGGYTENRIFEVCPEDLLKYNAMDAHIEYNLAMRQMRELGIQPHKFLRKDAFK